MRFLLTIIFSLIGFVCSSQQSDAHIQFMGIPLNGTSSVFVQRLEQKGFVKIGEYENSASFYGKFANEIVNLTLFASPRTDTVFKVIIRFPEKNNWTDLKSDYFSKKDLYCSKYLLTDEFEFFSSPYDEGDGYEMYAVKKGKCNYASFFSTNGGRVAVEICDNQCISVIYEDSINITIAKEELQSNALDDI